MGPPLNKHWLTSYAFMVSESGTHHLLQTSLYGAALKDIIYIYTST